MNSIYDNEITYDRAWTHMALKTTVLRICAKVTDGELGACTKVKEYVQTTNEHQIVSVMTESLDKAVPAFINGLKNNFVDINFASLQKRILTSDQGVYAGFVLRTSGETYIYVGSSYGKGGLQQRVVNNHLRQSYRSREPDKPLYMAMDEFEARTFFVPLLRYKQGVPTGQVLLAESVCCAMFGSFRSPQYQQLRPDELPLVCWERGLNRSDPLQSWRCGVDTIGNDACTFRRLRTLDNCLKSGPVRIGFHPRRRHPVNGSYQFYLFDVSFTIPKHVAKLWELQDGSIVNVEWQIAKDFHPHAFAPWATESDDGRRVGIRVFTTVRQTTCDHWIVRDTLEAIRIANTLHDLLTGEIIGKDYEWQNSRKYIFQNPKHYLMQEKHLKIYSESVQRNVRTGLPYYNSEFIWDDRTRVPETRPAEMISQRDTQDKIHQKILADEDADNQTIDWDESQVSGNLENYFEGLYTRWLKPHHQDLGRQGCRIFTGEYVA